MPAALAVKRDERGRLMPGGANLNPGGRPKSLGESIRKLVDPAEIASTLLSIMRNESRTARDADRIAAAKLLAAYGWGQPTQRVEVSAATPVNVARMSNEDLALVERLLTEPTPPPDPDDY